MRKYFKDSIGWSSKITIITVCIAAIFSTISTLFLSDATIFIGLAVVFFFVLFGIASDTIGLSAAAAKEVPFLAMASKRVTGAREAVYICRNAEKFSSFFNDVIGDICGIVSGAASASVILQLALLAGKHEGSVFYTVTAVIFTSVVAGITVGGKAVCKTLAIRGSTGIILFLGKWIHFFEVKLKMNILQKIS